MPYTFSGQSVFVFDMDFAKNSTFSLKLNNHEPKNSLTGCRIKTLDDYFEINKKIESKSNLNLINKIPFDFDTLNISPSFDARGIAYKNMNISV